MIGLLKMFGKGILYVIGFPFFVAALVLFGAIGIFLFLFQLIKSIIFFFTGRKFFPELPEDKELRLMRERAMGVNEQAPVEEAPVQDYSPIQPEQSVNPTPMAAPLPQENNHQRNVERAVFPDMGNDFKEKPYGDYDYVEGSEEEAEMEEESILQEIAEEETPLEREEYIREPEPEYVPEPEPEPEPTTVEEMPMKSQTIETAVEDKIIADEILEEYVPDGSAYYDDADDEDTGSGVSIDYDVR